jgi:hypothetical protein
MRQREDLGARLDHERPLGLAEGALEIGTALGVPRLGHVEAGRVGSLEERLLVEHPHQRVEPGLEQLDVLGEGVLVRRQDVGDLVARGVDDVLPLARGQLAEPRHEPLDLGHGRADVRARHVPGEASDGESRRIGDRHRNAAPTERACRSERAVEARVEEEHRRSSSGHAVTPRVGPKSVRGALAGGSRRISGL